MKEKWKTMAKITPPDHYLHGTLQPVEYIKAQGWFPAFACGNILKYITRYPHAKGIEDLEKAKNYITELINYEKELK